MRMLQGLLLCSMFFGVDGLTETVFDEARQRHIPVEISLPTNNSACTKQNPCPVVFISAGYGVAHTRYQFLVNVFTKQGYLAVAVGHELPNDPPLSVTGNLYETRAENWQRGEDTILFLQNWLKEPYEQYDFQKVTLVGHSNGGDISAWLGNHSPEGVKQVITLDHRRVSLPRNNQIPVLSVRASDFPPDQGVLPSPEEQRQYPICIARIQDARHNDMSDFGPSSLKSEIIRLLTEFLLQQNCDAWV